MLKVAYWNTLRIFHLTELDLAQLNLANTDVPHTPALFEIYGFYPLGVLALAGLLTRRARRAPKWLWLVPLCLATSVLITGFIRFRSPLDPFLAMLAALALASAHQRLIKRRRRRQDEEPAQPVVVPSAPAVGVPALSGQQ
jgi:hypothetical protein